MAKKPPMQVHVQSSEFKALLQTQKESLQSLRSMEEIMKLVKLTEYANLYETKKLDEENEQEVKLSKETKKIGEEHLKVAKETAKHLKDLKAAQETKSEEAKAIANLAKSVASLKTLGDRFGDVGKKWKERLDPSNIKIATLSKMNIGGIFSKSIDRERFIKQQRAAGSTDDRSTLQEKFEGAYKTSRGLQKIGKEFEEKRKEAGLSESEFGKTVKGRELLQKKGLLAEEHAKYDIRATTVRQADDKTPTQKHADDGAEKEAQIEDQKAAGAQTDLLTKIEQNTRGDSPDQKIKPKEDEQGGGLLGKLLGGGGMGKALKGLKDFGVGIVLVSGALWVASKAFKSFAEVEWEEIGKGLVVLGGLTVVAKVLGNATGSLLKASVGLGALALVTWGISAAFKEFGDLDWETIGKGFAAIVGLGVVGVVLGSFAGPALLGAASLGALGAAVWVVGKGFQEMGEAFNEFVDGIERLSNIGFEGLIGVAGGLTALGGAMVAFGAGSAVAGLSNLVTGFLSAVTGQKTPVEQLVEIGQAGEGISKAGTGMQALGTAMKAFSEVKGDSLKALKQFPWEEATKFVAAGGSMSVDGGKVYNASKANADNAALSDGNKGTGNTTVVNAPVNNVANTTNVTKRNIRNQESSNAIYSRRIPYSNAF